MTVLGKRYIKVQTAGLPIAADMWLLLSEVTHASRQRSLYPLTAGATTNHSQVKFQHAAQELKDKVTPGSDFSVLPQIRRTPNLDKFIFSEPQHCPSFCTWV
jgi:hypothetical protein